MKPCLSGKERKEALSLFSELQEVSRSWAYTFVANLLDLGDLDRAIDKTLKQVWEDQKELKEWKENTEDEETLEWLQEQAEELAEVEDLLIAYGKDDESKDQKYDWRNDVFVLLHELKEKSEKWANILSAYYIRSGDLKKSVRAVLRMIKEEKKKVKMLKEDGCGDKTKELAEGMAGEIEEVEKILLQYK